MVHAIVWWVTYGLVTNHVSKWCWHIPVFWSLGFLATQLNSFCHYLIFLLKIISLRSRNFSLALLRLPLCWYNLDRLDPLRHNNHFSQFNWVHCHVFISPSNSCRSVQKYIQFRPIRNGKYTLITVILQRFTANLIYANVVNAEQYTSCWIFFLFNTFLLHPSLISSRLKWL